MEENKIHLGDCLDYMKGMGDNSVDLVLTDPPYGIEQAKGIEMGKWKREDRADYYRNYH